MRAHATGRTRTGSGAALQKRRGIPFLASSCLIVSLLTGSAAPASNTRRNAVVDVVERVRAAVVNIHSERTAQGPANTEFFSMAPSQNRINGMGTGVIIDSRGYIVTNHHVIEDVSVLRVRLSDGNTYTATVVSRDHEADLALLK